MEQESAVTQETVWEVFTYVVTHPYIVLVQRWNWKAATLSGIMRGSLYFFTHISLGLRAAIGAMSVEFLFRVVNSGASASVSQAFRKARPRWLATLCVMLVLPAYSHAVEYTLHTITGDLNTNTSILFSIGLSAVSALFNLFVMRRGALLVADGEQRSFAQDLKRLPILALQFVAWPFTRLFGRSG
jgi:hypothetical protein